MGAFKRCDYCGRTVNWNDVQERRTWLELHWDVLDEGHPEQVWDFCCWDCAVNFGLSRRKGPSATWCVSWGTESWRRVPSRMSTSRPSTRSGLVASSAVAPRNAMFVRSLRSSSAARPAMPRERAASFRVPNFKFRHAVPVRFADLDVLGHVNHIAYLEILEAGRIAYYYEVAVQVCQHPRSGS